MSPWWWELPVIAEAIWQACWYPGKGTWESR